MHTIFKTIAGKAAAALAVILTIAMLAACSKSDSIDKSEEEDSGSASSSTTVGATVKPSKKINVDNIKSPAGVYNAYRSYILYCVTNDIEPDYQETEKLQDIAYNLMNEDQLRQLSEAIYLYSRYLDAENAFYNMIKNSKKGYSTENYTDSAQTEYRTDYGYAEVPEAEYAEEVTVEAYADTPEEEYYYTEDYEYAK